ncbi:MAG: hypothetical protein U0R72_11780 [Nakamurella multipartita]
MYNYYREDWLIDWLAGTAAAAFDHTPCVDKVGGGQAVVSAAPNEQNQSCGTPWQGRRRGGSRQATDDWPFLYPGRPRSRRSTCGRWATSCSSR